MLTYNTNNPVVPENGAAGFIGYIGVECQITGHPILELSCQCLLGIGRRGGPYCRHGLGAVSPDMVSCLDFQCLAS